MLEVLLPFGLPPDELSRDLLASLRAPALLQLLARASAGPGTRHSGLHPRLPHELWLEQQLGPLAAVPAVALAQAGIEAHLLGSGDWFMLFPIHLHIARDHLVLTDQRQLPLPDSDSRALFASAAGLFQEAGLQLLYGDARCWFLRAADWPDLQTCSPDAACGHNVEIWMPKGAQARAWRKLQNEVQMQWFNDPVNQARQAQGWPVVNSLWLHRIAAGGPSAPLPGKSLYYASTGSPDQVDRNNNSDKGNISGNGGNMHGNGDGSKHGSGYGNKHGDSHVNNSNHGCSPLPATPDKHILVADTLIGPALASDWSAWLDAFAALDANWFAPLLANQSAWPLRLTLGNSQSLRQFTCTRAGRMAFWRNNGKPGLMP